MAAAPLLQLAGVGCSFAGLSRPVLDGIELTVQPGELVGLLGPNGAGKTTLLRLAAGLLAPTRGQVLLDGAPLRRLAPAERARRIAVVRQETTFPFPCTVQEVVLMGRTPWRRPGAWWETAADREIVARALADCEVTALAGRSITTLSGGERQRVLVARALAQQPALLLLDEPTASLDLQHQVGLVRRLRRQQQASGFAVLAALHDLNLASQLCTRLLLLHRGRLVADGPPEQVLEPARLQQIYGVALHCGRLPGSGARFVVPLASDETPPATPEPNGPAGPDHPADGAPPRSSQTGAARAPSSHLSGSNP